MAARELCVPLTDCINNAILECKFPDILKLADVAPIFKKEDPMLKENYRPISLLPSFSKIFERILLNQLNTYFENKLSKFLCGFRKQHSTQHALIELLKNWQHCLDNSGSCWYSGNGFVESFRLSTTHTTDSQTACLRNQQAKP